MTNELLIYLITLIIILLFFIYLFIFIFIFFFVGTEGQYQSSCVFHRQGEPLYMALP